MYHTKDLHLVLSLDLAPLVNLKRHSLRAVFPRYTKTHILHAMYHAFKVHVLHVNQYPSSVPELQSGGSRVVAVGVRFGSCPHKLRDVSPMRQLIREISQVIAELGLQVLRLLARDVNDRVRIIIK